MQLQVSWIFVWNIQSPSVWPFLESSVDETVKESALMPFNPSRVFVLVRLQVKVSDEADKMVHHKKGVLNLKSSFDLLMWKKINISLQCMKMETKRNSEGWHFIMLYALVKYRDYQGRTNEGKACRTDSSGLWTSKIIAVCSMERFWYQCCGV